MRTEWDSASIGAVCDVVNGGTPKTGVSEYWGGPHRWITPAEMGKRSTPYIDQTDRTITDQGLQNSSARPLPPYSVILSSRAPIGHLVINTEPMATNQGCKGLVPRSRIDHKFLYYYLGSIVELLNDLGTGTTFKELSGGKLKDVPVPVPPLADQRRLVAILDEVVESIATAKDYAEKNLRNARELFESFMQSLFSGRGSGWTERTLEEICEIPSKLVDPREPAYLDLPHIGAGNIESKSGAVVGVRTAREEQLISGKFLFHENAVLYSKIRPYLMKVVRPSFSGLCSADIYPLVPKSGGVDRDYLYYLLLTPSFTEYAIKGSARAGMPKVNRDHLFAYRSWMPPVQEQARLAARLDALVDETERLAEVCDAKLAALLELKKSLLHQAFTGALTAKPTSWPVEEVA